MVSPSTVILGTGAYVPARVLTNDELSTRLDTTDEWIRTRTGIIEMDKRCHQMLGYEVLPQKLNFQTWQEHVHPDDRHRVLTTLQRQIALGEPFDMETRLLTQQGTWRWMEI